MRSKCCHADMKAVIGDEGTSYWKCMKCGKATDPSPTGGRRRMRKPSGEFYFARWKCGNCATGYPYEDNMKVLKGITFKKFSKERECPKCGCKGTIYFYGLAGGL